MNVEVEYDNEKEFNETIDMLEPMLDFPMSARDMENLKLDAMVSIAISLKRIADALQKPTPIQNVSQKDYNEIIKDDRIGKYRP